MQDPLPGVEKDKEELVKLLSQYKHALPNGKPVSNSNNVLRDLQRIVSMKKEEEFERVHFHFSGEG